MLKYQVNNSQNYNGLAITQIAIKLVKNTQSKVVSFADITINDIFVVKDLKIVNGRNGLFATFPQKSYDKNGSPEYYDIAHPLSGDLRKYIQQLIIDHYIMATQGQQSQQVPIQQAPIQQVPIQQAPIQQVPIQQAPIQQAPIQQAPIQQVPIQQAPIQQAPIQQVTPSWNNAPSSTQQSPWGQGGNFTSQNSAINSILQGGN